MATHKPLLPRAILDNIEVEGGVEDGTWTLRSQYTVRLYVDDTKVAKASSKPTSSVLKWEWNKDNEIWYEPSSTMKIVIHRGFSTDMKLFNHFVGQYEGKLVDLLGNDAGMTLTDKKGDNVPSKMKILLSPISDSADYIKQFMEGVDTDVARLPNNDTVLAAVSTLGQVLKLTKSIMDKFTQAHPILSASWSIISFLYQAVQETDLHDKSLRELSITLRELLGIADAVPNLPSIPNTINVIEEISRQSLEVASLIHEYAKLAFSGRTLKLQISDNLKSRIGDCQKRCTILKEKFHTRLHLDTNAKVDKIGRTVDLIKDDTLASEIKNWLCPPDNSRNREETHGRRQDDTCSWFLTGERFMRWLEEPGFLWVKGKSGCGKSILCSSIIDSLPQPSPFLGVAYFIFDGRDGQTELQLYNKLIRSLISQLSDTRHGGIPAALANLYKKCGSQQPLTNQLQIVLHDILESFSRVYIVVDALDECSDRKRTMAWVNELVADTHRKVSNLHIVVTSRPEPDIADIFKAIDPHSVDIGKVTANRDIIKYLEREIGLKFAKFDEITRKKIESGLREHADGSFRWVALQLAELEKCLSKHEIFQQMKNLPKDIDDIYKRILKALDGPYRADTITLLEWLSFSKRPLSVTEIAETITVDFKSDDGPIFKEEKRYINPRDVLVRCSSLVTKSKGTVKLSHFSVKEYLLSDRIEREFSINESAAHVKISEISVAYFLQFDSFEPLTRAMLHSSPLAEYAAKFWIDHAKSGGMEPGLLKLILRLLTAETAELTNWVRIYDIDIDEYRQRRVLLTDRAKVCSPIYYYASLAGMHQVLKQLLEKVADVNAKEGDCGNALQAASSNGHEAVVRLLLEKEADVNAEGWAHSNALQAASSKGHETVVKLLLENGANVNTQGRFDGNALQAASSNGDEAIVKLLLEKGADVNAEGGQHCNALQAASLIGHEVVVKLLLENGADANAEGGEYGSALQAASSNGHETVVKLLLENGADVNTQGGFYGNALQAASSNDHEAVVKLLLEKGADVNAEGGQYCNALLAASVCGHEVVVKLLLEKGADVNAEGGKYGSALQAASSNGHAEVMKLLLDTGADASALDMERVPYPAIRQLLHNANQ